MHISWEVSDKKNVCALERGGDKCVDCHINNLKHLPRPNRRLRHLFCKRQKIVIVEAGIQKAEARKSA